MFSIFRHSLFHVVVWSCYLALWLGMSLFNIATQHYLASIAWDIVTPFAFILLFFSSRNLWKESQNNLVDVTYIKPIIGYRQWRIKEKGILLSFHDLSEWPANAPKEASCHNSNRHKEIPAKRCLCGIYALKNPLDAYLYGKVALWGRIIEHKDGYRAQYAYPVELYVPGNYSIYQEIGERYSIPVTVIKKEET